jgi:hypothetical protein
MSERTITEAELKEALSTTALIIGCPTYNSIIKKAFPPMFKPKNGEVIVVSSYVNFSQSRVRVFDFMNDDGQYECFDHGGTGGNNTASWGYAKPLTPTQKGE